MAKLFSIDDSGGEGKYVRFVVCVVFAIIFTSHCDCADITVRRSSSLGGIASESIRNNDIIATLNHEKDDENQRQLQQQLPHQLQNNLHRRRKRDIQEIYEDRPIMFQPNVITRSVLILENLQALLFNFTQVVKNPNSFVIDNSTSTTTPSTGGGNETTTTTTDGAESTTLPSQETTTTEAGEETTEAPPSETEAPPAETEAPPAETEAPPAETENPPPETEVPAGTTSATGTSSAPGTAVASTASTTAMLSSTAVQGSNLAGILGLRMQSLIRDQKQDEMGQNTTDAPSESVTVQQPRRYSMDNMVATLKLTLNSTEMIMQDQLSSNMVITLERCAEDIKNMTKSYPYYNSKLRINSQELLYWLGYASLSVGHASARLQEQAKIHALIGSANDVTSVITAGFCFLAILLFVFLCYLSCRKRKPYHNGMYKLDLASQDGRPNAGVRRNPSESTVNADSLSPPNRQHPVYSSPSRAAVTTRSNPLYSSHRSVDVERPVDTEIIPRPNNSYNYDVPKASDNNRSSARDSDPVAEKNERNSASVGRGDRPISPQPNTQAPDYKDPRRNRRLGHGRDNDGYAPDEMIGVRSDSESVL